MDTAAILRENVDAMMGAPAVGVGMDVVIVSTTTPADEDYWQRRLEATRGLFTRPDAIVIAVHEDWEGGAGNGLGTLYALLRAEAKGRKRYAVDVLGMLAGGASVALYHTAGKGTRLAPLPASEGNNKPAVKLPRRFDLGGVSGCITVLEAVILQTSVYAASRTGRLSVFWGDQIFIPSVPLAYAPRHHADILGRLGPMPDAEGWRREGLHQYGLLAVRASGDAAQVEKVTHEVAADLAARGVIGVEGGVGVSLGSFSLSDALVRALLEEFSPELAAKRGKLDSDPHWWMPLTLDEPTYLSIMRGKGEDEAPARAHYARMQGFKERLSARAPELGMLGAVDVGSRAYWWDYGSLRAYHGNVLKLLAGDAEGEAVRRFFDVADRRSGSELGPGVDIDEDSVVLGCRIAAGRIRSSVLVGVQANQANLADCVAIDARFSEVSAEEALLYRTASTEPLALERGAVRVDVALADGSSATMNTALDRDGKADWDQRLPGNPFSYAELNLLVKSP